MRTETLIRTLRRVSHAAAVTAAVAAAVICCGCKDETRLRVLYWNIQNGMWAEQGDNYDNFVEWGKRYDPAVCVWCEAQTIYENGTDEG